MTGDSAMIFIATANPATVRTKSVRSAQVGGETKMGTRNWKELFATIAVAPAALIATLALATPALAEDKQPTIATGVGNWDSSVEREASRGATFTDSQLAAVQLVSKYFKELTTLQGRFVQTDPDNSVLKGKVFVAKPGRFRFEYSRPSRKVVISDGRFLAIQDHDLKTDETYELSNTPFRMLLRERVNLLRDAQVLQVEELPGQVSLVIRDKDPDAPSAIKIVLTTSPEPVLRGWITRDAQGLETKVEITSVEHGVRLAGKLFEREKFFMEGQSQR
ncbi:MAG: outer-membrane lipoprotein carrier protein LolA [Pseudomonadota bacterium]